MIWSQLLDVTNALRLAAIPAGTCAQCGGRVPPTTPVTIYASNPEKREIRWASTSECREHLVALANRSIW